MTSQHLGPVIVVGDQVIRLQREALDRGRHTEARIQSLIHAEPKIIPMNEIEPAYADMISLCTELPLASGYLDNLWITPRGGIVIGECKLFRNPQARREVIAQALDYARGLQRLTYEAFESAVGAARKKPGFRLYDFIENDFPGSELLQEAMFIDGVSRRLRTAQIMILIIGDGIREELEDLSDFLQLHAGIHANLALVDLSLWKMPDASYLVIPRLPLKTATVVRGVVRIEQSEAGIQVFDSEDRVRNIQSGSRGSTVPIAKSGSAEEFLELLRNSDSVSAEVMEKLIAIASETGIAVRYSPQYVMFDVPVRNSYRTVLPVKFDGYIWGGSLVFDEPDRELDDILRRGLKTVTDSMNGSISFTERGSHRFKKADGTRLKASDLKGYEEAIIASLSELTKIANDALSER